jgi:hypothetical protein
LADRGFAVRTSWNTADILHFENALKLDPDHDLVKLQKIFSLKKIGQVVEFFYGWKGSKRFKKWSGEFDLHPMMNGGDQGRAISTLRSLGRIDYNEDALYANYQNAISNYYKTRQYLSPNTRKRKVDYDKKLIYSEFNCDVAFEVKIDVAIYDKEADRQNCWKYITKRNTKTDENLFCI